MTGLWCLKVERNHESFVMELPTDQGERGETMRGRRKWFTEDNLIDSESQEKWMAYTSMERDSKEKGIAPSMTSDSAI